jgi:hypothetical protein
MAGFGGDAKVALLTGLIGGMNKRKENERKIEREQILNRQSEQLMRESEARVRNYEETQRRAEERIQREQEAALKATQDAAAEQERELARMEARIPIAMERFGFDENTARAIVSDPDFDPDQLLPEDERAMNDLDRARAAEIRQDTEAKRLENLLQAEVSDVLEHAATLKLRRGIESGDSRVVQAAIFELSESETAGFSQEAITQVMDSFQASDNEGKPVPMSEQRKRWSDQGSIMAQRLIQEAGGDVDAAIARAEASSANLPPDTDASDRAMVLAAIKALKEAKADGTDPLGIGG